MALKLEMTPEWEAAKRAEVLDIFRREFGAGRPDHYWSVVGPSFAGAHWCGALCLYSLREAGLAPGVMWESDAKRKRYGFAFRLKQLRSVREAKPGDLVYLSRYQHHCLFVRIEGNTVVTLDGNQLAPERVRECRRPVASVAATYSIAPWLVQAFDAEAPKVDPCT